MKFDLFIEDIKQNNWEVHGVEVYENGELTHSFGDTNGKRYPIYSATKTIVSIAAMMAVEDGKLDIQKSILEYLPETVIQKMSKGQQDIYQKITTKRLLTMSVQGYPFRPDGESWLLEALNYPLKDIETRAFDYSNVSAYLVGVVVTMAVGEDLYRYLDRKLFQPLGIENPTFGRCPDGYFYGASSMMLTVNELSRIGIFLANYGIYNGKRLLSAKYIKEATAIQQMNREGGYGYFIWKYRDGFSINGKWGQKCYVLPEKGLIITYLANMEEGSAALKASMERYILESEE